MIHFREESLQLRHLQYGGFDLELIHNASRDEWDRRQAVRGLDPVVCHFCDDSNPELVRPPGRHFRVLGNRFACLRYQSILVTLKHSEEVDEDFLVRSLRFARAYPNLTLMLNAPGAGGGLAHLHWLLGFHVHAGLDASETQLRQVGVVGGVTVRARQTPAYMLFFDLAEEVGPTAALLLRLVLRQERKDLNILIHGNRVAFIPREGLEVPDGFGQHKFGGLEMIGTFVMKSDEAFRTAEPAQLLAGIRQVSLSPERQQALEAWLVEG